MARIVCVLEGSEGSSDTSRHVIDLDKLDRTDPAQDYYARQIEDAMTGGGIGELDYDKVEDIDLRHAEVSLPQQVLGFVELYTTD